jgi:triosephosphate isomerase
MKPFIYIANWKMNLSYAQEIAYATDNKTGFIELSEKPETTIVLCPSFCSLSRLTELCKNTPIKIGAQDCSAYKSGAHTGQVSAQSLTEMGCIYCIVGHSERRTQFHETSELIAQKLSQLIANNITPILCIGETNKEHRAGRTTAVLEEQLAPILQILAHKETLAPLVIAYEPVWAIGTGITPSPDNLRLIFTWLHGHLQQKLGHASQTFKLIYGGSVDEKTGPAIAALADVNGLLVGGASIDFQKFKKIVELQK